jgi:hypothetical protein
VRVAPPAALSGMITYDTPGVLRGIMPVGCPQMRDGGWPNSREAPTLLHVQRLAVLGGSPAASGPVSRRCAC